MKKKSKEGDMKEATLGQGKRPNCQRDGGMGDGREGKWVISVGSGIVVGDAALSHNKTTNTPR